MCRAADSRWGGSGWSGLGEAGCVLAGAPRSFPRALAKVVLRATRLVLLASRGERNATAFWQRVRRARRALEPAARTYLRRGQFISPKDKRGMLRPINNMNRRDQLVASRARESVLALALQVAAERQRRCNEPVTAPGPRRGVAATDCDQRARVGRLGRTRNPAATNVAQPAGGAMIMKYALLASSALAFGLNGPRVLPKTPASALQRSPAARPAALVDARSPMALKAEGVASGGGAARNPPGPRRRRGRGARRVRDSLAPESGGPPGERPAAGEAAGPPGERPRPPAAGEAAGPPGERPRPPAA